MKKWLFLCLAIVAIIVQAMATNLVLTRSSGTQLLQDIATIGKVVFVGDDLQLLAHDGTLLAQEPIAEVQQITFAERLRAHLRRGYNGKRYHHLPKPYAGQARGAGRRGTNLARL